MYTECVKLNIILLTAYLDYGLLHYEEGNIFTSEMASFHILL